MRTQWALFGVPCVPGAGDRAVWGGRWGPFPRLGTGFVGQGPNGKKNCFNRDSALAGSFQEFFGSSELRSRCATFLL